MATLRRKNAAEVKAAVKDPEERLRRSAVRRVLAGAAAAEVAAELHRSERWVFKWLARYDPNDEAWARSESPAPATVANKTAPEVEALSATPDEVTRRLGFRPRLLDPAYRIPARPPRRGKIEFIRLIRSDRLLRVMDARIGLPEGLVYEYVTAVLDVASEKLDVLHLGRHVKTLPFRLEG